MNCVHGGMCQVHARGCTVYYNFNGPGARFLKCVEETQRIRFLAVHIEVNPH